MSPRTNDSASQDGRPRPGAGAPETEAGDRAPAARADVGVRAGVGGRRAARCSGEEPGQCEQGRQPQGESGPGPLGSLHVADHPCSRARVRGSTGRMLRTREKRTSKV